MTDQRTKVLERLELAANLPLTSKAVKWLSHGSTTALSVAPLETTVYDVRNLWRLRQEISRSKGHEIEGADDVLRVLNDKDWRIKLEQMTFAGSGLMGNVWFEKHTGNYVGMVLFAAATPKGELRRAS